MKKLIVLGISILFLFSCQKNDEIIEPALNYMPLQIGNYWVWQHYSVDTLGVETALPKYDSSIIVRDTTIRGALYYIFEGYEAIGNTSSQSIIRDSSGYYVNSNGTIVMAENNFTDTLRYNVQTNQGDTLFTSMYKMEKPDYSVTVPVGTYDVLNCLGTIKIIIPSLDTTRYLNTYYADNVGMILSTYFFFHSPTVYEKRLTKYHIEN